MDYIVNTPPLDVFEHMAFDELAALSSSGRDVFLRFYNWSAPRALTFGYAQSAPRGFDAPFTRRPTGGGVVHHDGDLTFSLIFPHAGLKVKDVYADLHSAVNAALSGEFKVYSGASDYAPQTASGPGVCFVNPVESDLLDSSGQKTLGGAMRKFEKVFLYQGSFQSAGARSDARIKDGILRGAERFFKAEFKPLAAAEVFLSGVKKEAVAKYKSKEWINKF